MTEDVEDANCQGIECVLRVLEFFYEDSTNNLSKLFTSVPVLILRRLISKSTLPRKRAEVNKNFLHGDIFRGHFRLILADECSVTHIRAFL